MKKIARENVRTFLEKEARRKIVSCVFTKKDGSERKMTLRVGVKKNLVGGKNNVERLDRTYMTVYDMKNGYRTLNIGTLKSIKADGVTYEVI